MTRPLLTLAVIAAAALAGCNKQSHTIVAGSGPDDSVDNAIAHNTDIQLPPSISSSKSYRCKDNSVVYVDWLSDDKSANLRADKTGTPTLLAAAEAGKPKTAAGGYSLSGMATDSTITLERPGKGSQTCKA